MQFKAVTFLLSFWLVALSTCVVGFPMASPSENTSPSTIILTIGGEGEPITFPASSLVTISRRDEFSATEVDVAARQIPVVARLIAQGIVEIVQSIFQLIADEKGARSEYTQDFIDAALHEYPGLNWVICHTEHEVHFDGAQGQDWGHFHEEFPVFLGTIGYEIYWFRSGTFVRHGDGGYLNWAYGGNVVSRTDADGSSTVIFGSY